MRGCIAERVGCVGGAGASGEKMHYTVRRCIARKYAVMRCIACNSERYLRREKIPMACDESHFEVGSILYLNLREVK